MYEELSAVREAYVLATAEFENCKSYCIGHASICAWSVLWTLRDQMIAAQIKFYTATKAALKRVHKKPDVKSLEQDETFMTAFYTACDNNKDLEDLYFLSPEQAIITYYNTLN